MTNNADPDQLASSEANLKKLTDLHLHCLQRQGISWFRRTGARKIYLPQKRWPQLVCTANWASARQTGHCWSPSLVLIGWGALVWVVWFADGAPLAVLDWFACRCCWISSRIFWTFSSLSGWITCRAFCLQRSDQFNKVKVAFKGTAYINIQKTEKGTNTSTFNGR